jgi:DNA-directed RNA polymerase specialized sigma24 family protein
MSVTKTNPFGDEECLKALARRRGPETLRPLLERYLPIVYASAFRRTGRSDHAAEVARAVFVVLARRARRLRKRTVLTGWLFRMTALATRKLRRSRSAGGTPALLPLPSANVPWWSPVASEVDAALDRLPAAQRNAVLLRTFLGGEWDAVVKTLRTPEAKVRRNVERGLGYVARHLRRRGWKVDENALAAGCGMEACNPPAPAELTNEILVGLDERGRDRPPSALARRVLVALAWARWWRRLAIGLPLLCVALAVLGVVAWQIDAREGNSRLITAFLIWSVKHEGRTVPGLADPARPWPSGGSIQNASASIRTAGDVYQVTNVWTAHLQFTAAQWEELQPRRIGPLPHFFQPDGTVLLRHPQAQRSGLAGVLGFDFNWGHADLEFGGRGFTNVAARFKGNGTFLGSLYGWKRSFKVDLNKYVRGQKLGEVEELNFNNLINDHSCLSDALAFEFFREAGVPASRTAYAYLSLGVEGKWQRRPLGLYVMVEPVDEDFAEQHFGSKNVPLFKPVTYELFRHLGDDWSAYDAIYDSKTRATPEQRRRVIELARLVTFAPDAEFARRLGEFLDLEAFARFLAGQVLLSNYDSFLSNGQNFYVYLDPRTNKFGFIPWDMDLAWGSFFLIGTTREREEASIWHPWVGEHRFLERVLAVEEFRTIYRAQLETLLARLFVPERLYRRIDEIAGAIRGPLTAESPFRLRKFEESIGTRPVARARGNPQGADRPAHEVKRFIERRVRSVRRQLDGKSEGVILRRPPRE